jgi:hypothetical protein
MALVQWEIIIPEHVHQRHLRLPNTYRQDWELTTEAVPWRVTLLTRFLAPKKIMSDVGGWKIEIMRLRKMITYSDFDVF